MTTPKPHKGVVLLAGFFSLFIGAPFLFNMSVLFIEFLETFGKSKAETALIQSLASGVFYGAGVVSGMLVSRFRTRRTCVIGGLMAGTAISCSCLANSVTFLVFSIGIVSAFGMSLTYVYTVTRVGHVFQGKSQLMAVALINLGAGCGDMSYPLIVELLSRTFGWRGALLIVGGLMFNLIVCTLALGPPELIPSEEKRVSKLQNETNSSKMIVSDGIMKEEETRIFKRIERSPEDDSSLLQYEKGDNSGSTKHSALVYSVSYLLQNKLYILSSLVAALSMSSIATILVFYIDVLKLKNIDRTTAVLIYFFNALSNAGGRFLPGIIKWLTHVSVFVIAAFVTLIGTISFGLFPSAESFPSVVCLSCLIGFDYGVSITLGYLAVFKTTEIEHNAAAVGLFMTFSGAMNAIAGPLSGLLRDVSGAYDLSMYGCAGCQLFACAVFVGISVYRHNTSKPESRDVTI